MDSWGAFIQNYLVNNVHGETTVYGACEHGALVGVDGTVWASTDGFKLNSSSSIEVAKDDGSSEKTTINEFDHIIDAVKNKGDTTKMKKGGVHFMDSKWVVLDGYQGEGYYTQYFKKAEGGAAVTITENGNVVIGTFNSGAKAVHLKDGKQKEIFDHKTFLEKQIQKLESEII